MFHDDWINKVDANIGWFPVTDLSNIHDKDIDPVNHFNSRVALTNTKHFDFFLTLGSLLVDFDF